MPAAKIMLIRHAEKPNGDGGPGLMPNGAEYFADSFTLDAPSASPPIGRSTRC